MADNQSKINSAATKLAKIITSVKPGISVATAKEAAQKMIKQAKEKLGKIS